MELIEHLRAVLASEKLVFDIIKEELIEIRDKFGDERKTKIVAAEGEIEDSFQSFFGTKVKLNAGKRSGKIIIQYSTNDELERILNLIK